MATKSTPPVPKAPRAPRTPKPINAAAQSLLNEATVKATEARNQIKEAKALGKVIECIGILSEWGLEKVDDAVNARERVLNPVAASEGQ